MFVAFKHFFSYQVIRLSSRKSVYKYLHLCPYLYCSFAGGPHYGLPSSRPPDESAFPHPGMKQEMTGWQWHQLGPYANHLYLSFQTDNYAKTPSLNFYSPDALPDTQPTVSKQ